MDKKYFLNNGKEQFGPLSLEEISKMPLKEGGKVWVEGSENWKDISEFEELRPFIIKMPPPLIKGANKSKIIAKEIKLNFKLLIVALVIGICSYPIIASVKGGFKSMSYKAKFENLFKEYDVSNITTDTSSIELNVSFENKRDNLIREVNNFMPSEDIIEGEVQDYKHFNSQTGSFDREKVFDYYSSLDNNIKRSFGADTVFLSFICLILTSSILIVGRHLIKFLNNSIKWVNSNSKNEI